jgi:hypothetical protein
LNRTEYGYTGRVTMRSDRRSTFLPGLLTLAVVIWLAIGALAAGQRHYYRDSTKTCAHASTIAVTIIAGPLNYVGANPKVKCHLPEPSK